MFLLPIFEKSRPPFINKADVCSCERLRMQQKREAMRRRMMLEELLDIPLGLFEHYLDSALLSEEKKARLEHSKTKSPQETISRDAPVSKPNDRFCVQVRATNFRPDEISVKIQDGKILIHAKHQESDESTGSFVSRAFHREFSIPSNVDPEQIMAVMNIDGLLSIKEIPQPSEKEQKGELETKEDTVSPRNVIAVAEDRQVESALQEESSSDKTEIDKNRFFVPVQTRGFKPSEITVKINDQKITIHAKHEEKESGSYVFREMKRELTIPSDVDPETVVASMNDEGVLCITQSSQKNIQQLDVEKEVAISKENSVPQEEKIIKVTSEVTMQTEEDTESKKESVPTGA